MFLWQLCIYQFIHLCVSFYTVVDCAGNRWIRLKRAFSWRLSLHGWDISDLLGKGGKLTFRVASSLKEHLGKISTSRFEQCRLRIVHAEPQLPLEKSFSAPCSVPLFLLKRIKFPRLVSSAPGWSQSVSLHYVTPSKAAQSCKALSQNEMRDDPLAYLGISWHMLAYLGISWHMLAYLGI